MAFAYHETGRHLIAASITLAVVDLIAVAAKFWVRRRYKQGVKADDWLLLPPTLISTVLAGILSYGVIEGALGGTISAPLKSPERAAEEAYKLSLARKIQWPFLTLHPLAMGLVRISFLLFYLRIFSVNRARTFVLISIGIVIAWTISFTFAELFQCGTHFTSNWSVTLFAVHCPRTLYILFVSFLTAAILDLYILILPIVFILQLKLAMTKKLGVLSILIIGSATVVASIIRLALLAPGIFAVVSGPPQTYEQRSARLSSTIYWGQVELGVAIFVACLPTVQRVLRTERTRRFLARLGIKGITSHSTTMNSKHSFNTSSSRVMGKPRILVNQSIDVAYSEADTDSRPILSSEINSTKRSDENIDSIEMESGLGRKRAQASGGY
ncbi:hypothetical protein DM02DRAFT_4507 [Periconia macrospinosa]|uniref:Rhodopsin domain-containing protein n=1 Tax=Periconia macrospinosa TaxID=97972 RepID=A0A2V1EEI8_9PLEO|nr:hypothetical protein DM02DRAFT_4507 [Periconia macrospinosa]